MADNPNEPPYTLYTIEMGGVATPGYLREFDAMLAALPADVKASADVIRYPGPYNGYYVVELTPHPDLSRVTTFPKLLEAMTLLPGANHGGIALILQMLRREKAAMELAIPSQPAQVVPAVVAASPATKRVTDTPDDVARLKQLRAEHIKAYGKAPAFIATCQRVPMSRTTAKRHAPELCTMKNWKNKNYLPD